MKLKRTKRLPAALLATRSAKVFQAIPPEFQTREAVSTLGVVSALHAEPVLTIADLGELIEFEEPSRAVIQAALASLKERGAVVVSSAEFLAEPKRWIGEALLASGLRIGVRHMPHRVVLITNYCGGVGKTTLSLSLARQFRKVSGLATAVVEVGVGGSSLVARLGEYPTLYHVVTQSQPVKAWESVSIYPCDEWEANSLAADERLPKSLAEITRNHTLTVMDTFPSNPLWQTALELATDVIVVATPRPDSVAQTAAILKRLKDETAALNPPPRTHLVLNQVKTLGERLALSGQLSTWIGFDERRAEHLDGNLAASLLGLLYPNWSRTDHHNNRPKKPKLKAEKPKKNAKPKQNRRRSK